MKGDLVKLPYGLPNSMSTGIPPIRTVGRAAVALFGTLGGLVLPFVPGRLGRWRAVVHTVVLFVLIALTSDAARGAASGIAGPAHIPVLLAFGGLLLGYSLLLLHLTLSPHASGAQAAA